MKRPRWLVVQEEARVGRFVVRVMGQHHRRFTVEVLEDERSLLREVCSSRSKAERIGLGFAFQRVAEQDLEKAKAMVAAMLGGDT